MKDKELMEIVEDLQETNKLYKAVIDDIIDDASGYDGTTHEQLIGRLEDILQHGCISGTVGSLIYYSDTTEFYRRYKTEINAILHELMQEVGVYAPSELLNNFDAQDILCIQQQNQNLLAWFGYEEVARRLMYEINPDW